MANTITLVGTNKKLQKERGRGCVLGNANFSFESLYLH
jgi:hypothetical protein